MNLASPFTTLQFRSKCNGSIICLSPEVLNHFHMHRQGHGAKSEVGGQLFAELTSDRVQIVRATGPNVTDKRGWTWFNPDRRRQNAEIKRLFSQGLHFVGDWHTHRELQPKPSSLDLTSMQDCFKKSRHQLKAFVMVIVGQASFPAGLWVGLHDSNVWEQLR
jgi:integrative and conjugative element protein (TIGR02256 family)